MKFVFTNIILLLSLNGFSQQKWTLDSCITYAFKNNLQIQEAQINEQIQSKEVRFQKNKRLPTLSATVNNGFSYGFQQVFSGEFVGQYKEIQSYKNNGSINASVTLWNKNAQKISIENEKINLKITVLNTEQKKFELQLDIIAKYYSILIAKERLQLAKQTFENREKQTQNKEQLYELGTISKSVLSEE
jgi:outer membrane protein